MLTNKNYYINKLYEAYPILEKIDRKSKGIISERLFLKNF